MKLRSTVVNAIITVLVLLNIFFVYQYIEAIPRGEPGQGKSESIVNTTVHVGEPIYLDIKTTVDQAQCAVVSERHIINNDGHEVYSKWNTIPESALTKLQTGIRLKVDLPPLEPGRYYYISNVHLSCPGGTSYLRTTAYLPFNVIP